MKKKNKMQLYLGSFMLSAAMLLGNVSLNAAVSESELSDMTMDELFNLHDTVNRRARALLDEEILAQDVRIIEIEVTDSTDERLSMGNETGLILPKVYNGSDSVIHDIIVVAAAWDADGNPVILKSSLSGYDPGYMAMIYLTQDNLEPEMILNDEDSKTYSMFPFDLSCDVAYAGVMLASYTNEDGETWQNPLLDAWYNAYVGETLTFEASSVENAEDVPAEGSSDTAGAPAEEAKAGESAPETQPEVTEVPAAEAKAGESAPETQPEVTEVPAAEAKAEESAPETQPEVTETPAVEATAEKSAVMEKTGETETPAEEKAADALLPEEATETNGTAVEAASTASTEDEARKSQVFTDWIYVYRVQTALNKAGYDCGKPDGLAGQKTYDAMHRYQEDHDLPVTNDITGALIDSLGVE